MSSYNHHDFKISVSKDESDHTLKHRTTPRTKQPSSERQPTPRFHPPEMASSRRTISRRTQQKLNDPLYLDELRRHSIRVADHAWQRLSSQTSSSSLLLLPPQQQPEHHHAPPPPALSSSYFGQSGGTTTYFDVVHYSGNYSVDGSIGNSTIQSESVTVRSNNNHHHHHHQINKTPTEIATLRGTKRALRESNEVGPPPPLPHERLNETHDFDLDTLAGTIPSKTATSRRISNPFRRVARSFLRSGRDGNSVRVVKFPSNPNSASIRHKRDGDGTTVSSTRRKAVSDPHHTTERHMNNDTSDEAWMCGVCGMVFANELVADQHEQRHIIDVVKGMEWNKNNQSRVNRPNTMMSPICHEPIVSPSTTSILMPSSKRIVEVENLPKTPQLQRGRGRISNGIIHNTSSVEANSLRAVGTSSPMEPDVVRFAVATTEPPVHPPSLRPDNDRRPHSPHIRFEHDEDDDEYPGLDADLPPPLLSSTEPQRHGRANSNEVRFASDDDALLSHAPQQNPLAVKHLHEFDMLYQPANATDRVVLADEALYDVTSRAVSMILTRREADAEYELALLARDKSYYDECTKRAIARRVNPSNRYRSDREDVLAKVQNKFVDAYQLMKESDGKKGITDQYNRINKKGGKEGTTSALMKHTGSTIYVNVMVKNSVEVVRHELERLAKQRWDVSSSQDESLTRFERFRVYTQMNIVKLAGIALASDFTPRRIAVQLSNDLYRLLTPKLKRRGVAIETEIEYRVGPYFVLAVNIKTIDWWKLIKSTHKDSVQRQLRWEKERRDEKESTNPADVAKKVSLFRSNFDYFQGSFSLSVFDVIERAISLLYYIHWSIYLPICWVSYYVLLGPSLRHFIITTVADEIFSYVEEKGMEMEIRVCRTETQAAFMLSALREIRVDGQELKKKIEQSESREKGLVLGPLMGPAIAADKGSAPPIPQGFEIPENLEYIGLELNLPVGFQRLRWALLSKRSNFVTEAIYKTEAKYENIVMGEWNKFADLIGEPKLPDNVNPDDFLGAEMEGEYLMPKSAFVSANMCYETHYILAYNDFCFCLKKRAKNPDAPFGKTFLAWTQYLVINTGNDTCKLTCSVQPEFPHGTPMVSRQITSGMRAGTGELFVLIGSTIEKYSDEFP